MTDWLKKALKYKLKYKKLLKDKLIQEGGNLSSFENNIIENIKKNKKYIL